jgi:acetyl esterase/lipase
MVCLISCDKDDDNISPPVISAPIVKLNTTYEVNITEDITYAEGLSHDSWNSANNSVIPLLMDSYVPDNILQNRPLLMLIHGGGFSGGSKQQEALVTMANYYASRGFVVFSIDYRLRGDKGTIPQEWIDATTNVDPTELDQLYAM